MSSVDFSPDGKRLVSASTLGSWAKSSDFSAFASVRCWDVSTGKRLWQVKTPVLGGTSGDHAIVCDALFSPDGRFVAAYQNRQSQVFLLDGATGRVKATQSLGQEQTELGSPSALAFAPNGKRLFVRGKNAILFWDLAP